MWHETFFSPALLYNIGLVMMSQQLKVLYMNQCVAEKLNKMTKMSFLEQVLLTPINIVSRAPLPRIHPLFSAYLWQIELKGVCQEVHYLLIVALESTHAICEN